MIEIFSAVLGFAAPFLPEIKFFVIREVINEHTTRLPS